MSKLTENNYVGKVVYNEDPNYSGRCRVRVYGLMDDLEDDLLPWFVPQTSGVFSSSTGCGSLSVPKVGSFVRVRFANGDIYSGEYTSIQNVDPYLITKIKDNYGDGTHVICCDSDNEMMILYQPNIGFNIYYKDSFINISDSNTITLQHANSANSIQIDSDNITIVSNGTINITGSDKVNVSASKVNIDANSVAVGSSTQHPAVKGDALVGLLESMIATINEKYPIGVYQPNVTGILSSKVTIAD